MHAKTTASPINLRDVLLAEGNPFVLRKAWMPCRGMSRRGMSIGVLVLGALVGCSDGDAFPLEQITGKVTYEDGSLIEAKTIQIMFKSIDVKSKGNKAPRGAKGMIDPETGQFGNLSTWKTGDGVICGRNKVAIVPMEYGKGIDPMGRPKKKALSAKYFTTRTSDLEVEVVSGGENYFELMVKKPGK